MMEYRNRRHGSLIAFEGPENLISTQLHMLPPSPQLFILPSLKHYMKDNTSTPSSFWSYIKDVHQAALARREAALRFLDESTSNNKRLVFLNGGTAGAVSQCISAISERHTSGDAFIAEAVYKHIAIGGVRGLEQGEKYASQEDLGILSSERDDDEYSWDNGHEDPTTRAMRAADALYKETDALQPMDWDTGTRPRSLSLPMLDYSDWQRQVSSFIAFGSSPSEGAGSAVGDDEEEEAFTTGEADNSTNATHISKSSHHGPNRAFETIKTRNEETRATVHLTATGKSSISPPVSPEGVVYGEARLVQMAASKLQKNPRRYRSLDDVELKEARRRRISVQLAPAARASPVDSLEAKSRHLSIVEDPYSPNNLLHLLQAKFVKAQTTTIRRSPTFVQAQSKPARETYLHQGTDVADFSTDDADLDRGFEPVLPLHEDLVIHFTTRSRNHVLDLVIQSLKDGSYTASSATADSLHTAETDSCPSTPKTADLFDLESRADSLSPVMEVPSADEASDHDPYAQRGSDARRALRAHPKSHRASPRDLLQQQPPAPAQTPMPLVETKFHEFLIAGRPNAIVTQNALRAVLETYHPQQDGSAYFQLGPFLLPDMDKLWRPVFQVSDAQGSKPTQPTVDLILAIGCQKGVKHGFVASLTGQIEKLGSKANGMSRSGRLDIRYLIATAMQSSRTQSQPSLSAHTFTDSPYSLACLLVPHLETYLATNPATRFLLLSYPAEHLATILSLRKLIGAGTLKVVGICDTSDIVPSLPGELTAPSPISTKSSHSSANMERINTSEPTALTCPRTPIQQQHHQHHHHQQSRPTAAHRRRISFSRADYVLASSATEAETATLLSALCKALMAIDPFYTPEPQRAPAPALTLVSKFATPPGSAPATPPFSPTHHGVGVGVGEASTPRRGLAALHFPFAAPPTPLSPPSEDGSLSRWSTRSWSRQPPAPAPPPPPQQQQKQQQQQQNIADAVPAPRPKSLRDAALSGGGEDPRNASVASAVSEGDLFDDDAEERRLMPMYMQQSKMRKGNSRKALKWLGLA